jgi:transcription elongation factor Elf1
MCVRNNLLKTSPREFMCVSFFFLNDLAPVCLCAFLCAVYKHSIGKLHCKANQCSLIIHDALYFDAADFYSDVVDEYET